jgi:hypothetical protein
MMHLFNLHERVHPYRWRSVFEGTVQLKGVLIRAALAASGCVTVEVGLLVCSLAKRILALKRDSGLLFVALYLKQCSVSLQRFYASTDKQLIMNQSSSVSVSLSKTGIPRIIPKHLRFVIMRRDARADLLVKVLLTLFSLSRIIMLAKPVSKGLFKSITDPPKDLDLVLETLSVLKYNIVILTKTYVPWIREIPLNKGFSWMPSWKSTPNLDTSKDKASSIYINLMYEMAAFGRYIRFLHAREGIFSPGMLFFKGWILYPLDYSFTRTILHEHMELYEKRLGLVIDELASCFDSSNTYSSMGRLSQVVVGAGKRRVFAIGNYIKQRLLYPLHEWAMNVLKRIPMDGTFNQSSPVKRLSMMPGIKEVYSFDLSSATDRFPVVFIHEVVAYLFGSTFASCAVNGCLALNVFDVLPSSFGIKSRTTISFNTGQPLGYYGSWALFALSHHYLVWLAASIVHQNATKRFDRYALLGDDIVIADKRVALQYRELLNKLGVSISEPKSIVSNIGCAEFAKQFWTAGLCKDLSPVSLQALMVSRSPIGIGSLRLRYLFSMNTCLRLAGAGYRVRSGAPLSRRWRRFKAVCSRFEFTKGHLELWLGRGKPLHPYAKGVLIQFLIERLKPKDIKLPSLDYVFEGQLDNAEYTLTRNWLNQWLLYIRAYYLIQLSSNPKVDDFFDIPMVEFSWKRNRTDLVLVRYGILWKLYDMVYDSHESGLSYQEIDRLFPLPLGTGTILSCSTEGSDDQDYPFTDPLLPTGVELTTGP